MQAVTQSLSDGLGAIVGALPALIGAILILVVGFIIAKVLQGIVTRVLQSMGFQGWMESGGIKQFFDRSQTNQTRSPSWASSFSGWSSSSPSRWPWTLWGSRDLGRFGPVHSLHPADHSGDPDPGARHLLANFVAGIVRGATGSNVIGSVAQYGIIVFAAFAASPSSG